MKLEQGSQNLPVVKEELDRKAKYAQYLLSDDWAEKRQVALRLDGYECFNCKATKQLHVHHMSYKNWYDVDPRTDLVTLCKGCHNGVHDGKLRLKKRHVNLARGRTMPKKKKKKKVTARVKKWRKFFKNNQYELNGHLVVDVNDLKSFLTL